MGTRTTILRFPAVSASEVWEGCPMDESVLACVPGLLKHARGFQLDEERAEDLVATTLTWAIDHVDQFDPRFGIENWLVFITDMLACEVLGKPTPAP